MVAREFKERMATSIYMEREERELLDEIRWREKKSTAQVIRRAIQEYIQHHGAGNETFSLDNWHDDSDFKAVPTLSSKSEIWYRYLNECTDQELLDIMIKTTRINQQCKDIKKIK